MKRHLVSRCFMRDFELHTHAPLSDFRPVYICEKFIVQQIFIRTNLCRIHIFQFNPICTEFSHRLLVVLEKTGGKCRNLFQLAWSILSCMKRATMCLPSGFLRCVSDSHTEEFPSTLSSLLLDFCGIPANVNRASVALAGFRRHTADFILTSNSRYFKLHSNYLSPPLLLI